MLQATAVMDPTEGSGLFLGLECICRPERGRPLAWRPGSCASSTSLAGWCQPQVRHQPSLSLGFSGPLLKAPACEVLTLRCLRCDVLLEMATQWQEQSLRNDSQETSFPDEACYLIFYQQPRQPEGCTLQEQDTHSVTGYPTWY